MNENTDKDGRNAGYNGRSDSGERLLCRWCKAVMGAREKIFQSNLIWIPDDAGHEDTDMGAAIRVPL